MSFDKQPANPQDFNVTWEAQKPAPNGQHRAKLIEIVPSRNSFGNDQIAFTFVIPEGPFRDHKARLVGIKPATPGNLLGKFLIAAGVPITADKAGSFDVRTLIGSFFDIFVEQKVTAKGIYANVKGASPVQFQAVTPPPTPPATDAPAQIGAAAPSNAPVQQPVTPPAPQQGPVSGAVPTGGSTLPRW